VLALNFRFNCKYFAADLFFAIHSAKIV